MLLSRTELVPQSVAVRPQRQLGHAVIGTATVVARCALAAQHQKARLKLYLEVARADP
jgi:hypothetical protein